jgi:hypothetical protein
MRTIKIEMHEGVYETFLQFLNLLPKSEFKVYEDTPDLITREEQVSVHRYNTMIDKGDFSEFVDFNEMKNDVCS